MLKIDLVPGRNTRSIILSLSFSSFPVDNINSHGYYLPVTAYQLQGRGSVATYLPSLSFVGFTM
ncbi:MAG: hypothetical protein IIZ75_12575, partial [Lachnospiraceae bacterium]|nr:hypothetical protein [Lachnospiraceae bacterium]